jgi:hypothetical protein
LAETTFVKDWQFWILLAAVGAVFYVVYRTATGLQNAQTQITSYTTPINNFLSKLGI